MNIDARSVETDREGTAARLVDTIPSVLLSASDINVPHLSSEDYSAGSEKCEGLCCNDDTVPYQPTEASVLGKIKTIYGDGKSKRERSFQEYWYKKIKWLYKNSMRTKVVLHIKKVVLNTKH